MMPVPRHALCEGPFTDAQGVNCREGQAQDHKRRARLGFLIGHRGGAQDASDHPDHAREGVLGLACARREQAECGEGGGGRGETGLPPAVGAEEVVYIPQDWNPEEASADGH